jgi:hypothetical protein
MAQGYQYYLVPLDEVAADRTDVWYGTWTLGNPMVQWSQQRPAQPDQRSAWAVCVTASDSVSAFATLLGNGGKDLPPPQFNLVDPTNAAEFQTAFSQWLAVRSI